jgi:hypothetical protein
MIRKRKLRVIDARGEREVPLAGTVTIGRDSTCQIIDADPRMSRRHAEIFPEKQSVVIRDLGSRNGMTVNGEKVVRAVLSPGDVVKIAGLRILFLEEPLAQAPEPEGADERTVLLPGPGQPPVPAPAAVPAGSDEERTRLARQSTVADGVMPVVAQAILAEAPLHPNAGSTAVRDSRSLGPTGRRAGLLQWSARVWLLMTAMAVVVFSVPATLGFWWHGELMRSAAVSRASALSGWLAARATDAIENDTPLLNVTREVLAESGVVAVAIVSPEGRVLAASSSNLGENVGAIPGVATAPAEITERRHGWNGGLLEVARPVGTHSHPRAAVVWITLDHPTAMSEEQFLLVIGLGLLLALSAGLLGFLLVRRMTLPPLMRLATELRVAAAGQDADLSDPLGSRSTRELSAALATLVARDTGHDAGARRVVGAGS